MYQSKKTKWTWLLVLAVVLAFTAFGATSAFAADLPALIDSDSSFAAPSADTPILRAEGDEATGPAHAKNLIDNGDGTFTLELNVTGDADRQVNKVNVIVVFDTSSSMNDATEGPGSQSRLAAAQTAINSLANSLLAYNGGDNPDDTVQMALITFDRTAEIQPFGSANYTGSYSDYADAVNGVSTAQGTNWEDGLRTVEDVSFGDSDPTYVIFVSDGEPSYYLDDDGNVAGTGNGTVEANVNTCYSEAVEAAEDLLADNEYILYTIGIYHASYRLENLSDAAGAAGYYPAEDTAALEAALDDILEQIELAGIGAVKIDDGTTESVTTETGIAHLLEVDTDSFKYYRSGGSYGTEGLGTEWKSTDDPAPPAAELKNGSVVWDISSIGVLEDEVTYHVTFEVYPSQETLDIIADLKNGKIEYVEEGGEDDPAIENLDANIQKYLKKTEDGEYVLETNTVAKLSYVDTRTGEEGESEFTNPPPKKTSAVQTMAVTKQWENQLDKQQAEPIALLVNRDGEEYFEVELNNGNNWKGSVFASIGIMTVESGKVEIKAPGHDFAFAEPEGLAHNWELDAPTIHPMKINNVDTVLVELTDAEIAELPDTFKAAAAPATAAVDGTTYYKLNFSDAAEEETAAEEEGEGEGEEETADEEEGSGDLYYRVDPTATQDNIVNLIATNHRKSNLNVTKEVDGDDAPADALFEYTATVTDEGATDGKVWFSIRDTETKEYIKNTADVTYVSAKGLEENVGEGGNYFAVPSGAEITFKLQAGWNLRFINLATETTYEIEETVMPDSFTLEGLTGERESDFKYDADGNQTSSKTEDAGDIEDAKVSGTIEATNSVYTMTYTNFYCLNDVEITKVWNDNDDEEGLRPDVDAFKAALKLFADGSDVTADNADKLTVTDNGDNTYTAKWKGLDRYSEGKEITYTVTEDAIEGYETTYVNLDSAESEAANDGGTIINRHQTPPVKEVFSGESTTNIDGELVQPGDELTYEITYTNTGEEGEIEITDTIPANTAYVEGSAGEGEESGGVITWKITAAAGEEITVSFKVTVDEDVDGDVIPNEATVKEGENSYTSNKVTNPTPVNVTIEATKVLTGLTLNEGDFKFTIAAKDPASPMPEVTEVTNDAEGLISFGPIAFEEAGEYTYILSEIPGNEEGMTYDETPKEVTVSVSADEETGKLTAEVAPEKITFENTYTPPLNKDDHRDYIVGYPDGKVHPEGNITRAEVCTIFFRLLDDDYRNEMWMTDNPYSDVKKGQWFNNAVSTMTNCGVIKGYPDGTFRPNNPITRAEFATIATRFFKDWTESVENTFSDIDGHWAYDYILKAVYYGLVSGYPDGTFRPNENITRAEAMTVVNRVLGHHPAKEGFCDGMKVWPDNNPSDWFYADVQEATNNHEYVEGSDPEQWTKVLPPFDWSELERR